MFNRTVAYVLVTEKRDTARTRRRLNREDWTDAALTALAEGGVAAVAIEPLAQRLGATKGSAYWHFPGRDALLRATLERWADEHTEAVIDLVEAEADPARRLHTLFASVLLHPDGNAVELALLASADDPVVGPVLRRVTERRVSYLASLLAQYGFPRAHARRRAVLAYATYLGHAQLLRAAPEMLPKGRTARQRHVDETVAAMLGRAGRSA
jgi:AcrR family transcriptional regulator